MTKQKHHRQGKKRILPETGERADFVVPIQEKHEFAFWIQSFFFFPFSINLRILRWIASRVICSKISSGFRVVQPTMSIHFDKCWWRQQSQRLWRRPRKSFASPIAF
jgi:hypothetical protein